VVALLHSPSAALAVALVFLFIHQVEGHIVIPKLMGSAVRVHPLVVIFTLLAAAELFGIGGVLICLPLLAVGREVAAFLAERIDFESWRDQVLPLAGVSVEPASASATEAGEPPDAAQPGSAEVVTQVLPNAPAKSGEGEPGHDHERLGKLAPES
jgi:hypothetical protein